MLRALRVIAPPAMAGGGGGGAVHGGAHGMVLPASSRSALVCVPVRYRVQRTGRWKRYMEREQDLIFRVDKLVRTGFMGKPHWYEAVARLPRLKLPAVRPPPKQRPPEVELLRIVISRYPMLRMEVRGERGQARVRREGCTEDARVHGWVDGCARTPQVAWGAIVCGMAVWMEDALAERVAPCHVHEHQSISHACV